MTGRLPPGDITREAGGKRYLLTSTDRTDACEMCAGDDDTDLCDALGLECADYYGTCWVEIPAGHQPTDITE